MAKTFAYAKTKTYGYTKIELINAQFKIAFVRTTYLSVDTIMNSILLGIDKQWIREVNVYGLDSDNLCRAQLIMEIDWDEHKLQMAQVNTTIIIDENKWNWQNDTIIELSEAIQLFTDYASETALKTNRYQISYASWVDKEEAKRTLGMVPEPILWKDKVEGFEFQIPEIQELRVGFYCVE